ncbi:sporulation protein YqfD [Sporolactobacillus kofuensis]|uniref:Sporulation protein YqfD n=1 Tax=Sporolactobacillus kofuensis TaxID=269672 RepID=A0ABW1WBE0_9BACL|nr:sporulation protein YqfD [Sporolactobacillus kofuensis]MCO7175683.1 sporulation protein YqfD [Sporolactobacillus kofuensis]
MRHTNHIKGYLKVEIIGNDPERFIRHCVRERIKMWQITRKNETTLICYVELIDSDTLQKGLKETNCRVHILEKSGIPFFIKKIQKRLGIVAGILFFVAMLLLLSNMVWSINVDGADANLEEQIRTILKQNHLYEGSLDFFVPDTNQLENALTTKLTKVTWIGVSREGTTYHVNVVQKKYPKPRKVTGPQNLVATKQAIVQRLFVETGQPVVESDQFVKAGQLLVSGVIGNDKTVSFVSAKGQVIGETWYHSETQIPLVSQYTLYTEQSYQKYRLRFWHLSAPLWGLKKKPYTNYDLEKVTKPIRFLIWRTPFTYVTEKYRQKKMITRTLTINEATEEAIDSSNKKLLAKLPKSSKIIESIIDEKKVIKGKLYVRSHQVVHENIARAQAINREQVKRKINEKKD